MEPVVMKAFEQLRVRSMGLQCNPGQSDWIVWVQLINQPIALRMDLQRILKMLLGLVIGMVEYYVGCPHFGVVMNNRPIMSRNLRTPTLTLCTNPYPSTEMCLRVDVSCNR